MYLQSNLGGDFSKFCGLLRVYELYIGILLITYSVEDLKINSREKDQVRLKNFKLKEP